MRTLIILSTELKTKLQRQTMSAHASGPYSSIRKSEEVKMDMNSPIEMNVTNQVL